jgi:uncharacterized membrane protein
MPADPRTTPTPVIASRAPRTPAGRRALRRWFDVGVVFKGIEGLAEIVAGTWLAFDPAVLHNAIFRLTAKEVLHDPDDRIANALRDFAEHMGTGRHSFAVAYLAAHGVVKVVLAGGLLANKRWAYPFAIVALLALAAYQLYRFTHTHAPLLPVSSAIDVAIAWLVWREAAIRRRAAHVRG